MGYSEPADSPGLCSIRFSSVIRTCGRRNKICIWKTPITCRRAFGRCTGSGHCALAQCILRRNNRESIGCGETALGIWSTVDILYLIRNISNPASFAWICAGCQSLGSRCEWLYLVRSHIGGHLRHGRVGRAIVAAAHLASHYYHVGKVGGDGG
jgi:hypothetical protein